MPRFVRPAFLSVRVPGRATKTMSPLSAGGFLTADLTVRTPIGAVSRAIQIVAGAHNENGDTDVTVAIPRGFVVELYDETGQSIAPPRVRRVTSITITPTNEA